MQANPPTGRTTAKGLSTPENRGVPGSSPGLAIALRRRIRRFFLWRESAETERLRATSEVHGLSWSNPACPDEAIEPTSTPPGTAYLEQCEALRELHIARSARRR
jgi:hypothetical protein